MSDHCHPGSDQRSFSSLYYCTIRLLANTMRRVFAPGRMGDSHFQVPLLLRLVETGGAIT